MSASLLDHEDGGDARALVHDILVRAIDRWHAVSLDVARAAELAALDPRLERWANRLRGDLVAAERSLVRAILMTAGDEAVDRQIRPERWRWPSRGVVHHQRTYLAVASPDRAGDLGSHDGPDLMRLVAVERRDVLNLTAGLRIELIELTPAQGGPGDAEADPMRAEPAEFFAAALRSLGAAEVMRRLINPAATSARRSSRRPGRPFGKAVIG